MPPPTGSNVSAAQTIVAHFRGQTYSFEAQIQETPDEFDLVALDNLGRRAMSVKWRGGHMDYTRADWLPAAVRPADMLGDIAIAYETTRKEADDEQKPFDHHLSHLAVHGFLHLIGYDHENDGDAEAMETLEQQILAQLGIPDPYADRERMD